MIFVVPMLITGNISSFNLVPMPYFNVNCLKIIILYCFPLLFQSKALRRLIQQHFRLYAQLTESECVFKFFETLYTVSKFNHEKFKCALGVSIMFVSCDLVEKVIFRFLYLFKCTVISLLRREN